MKTKKIFSGFMLLAFVAVITSCSTSVEIAKRSFNNGYYVHVVNNKKAAPREGKAFVENEKPVIALTEQKSLDISGKEGNENEETTPRELSSDNSISASQGNEPAIVTKKINSEPVENFSDNTSSVKNGKQFERPNATKNKLNRNAKQIFSAKDVPGFLLVLLCIFLPPLAIYLVDGVGTPFWVDLILWLIGVGVGFSVNTGVGLLCLIAIIYAFVICF